MPFDPSTAKPVSGGFDLNTARPAQDPAPASKPFGEQLNDFIKDAPRQVGLTARYGIEGLGGMFDSMVGNPVRALASPIFGNQPTANTGKAISDLAHLPEPETAKERIVGDAARMVAGGAVPLGLASGLAARSSGVTRAVAETMAANPLQQLASAGAAGAAGGYTRETGGGAGAQTIASLAAGVAAPLAINGAGKAVTSLRQLARPAPTPTQIDVTINNALQPSGMTLSQLSQDVQAGIRNDVAQALKTGENLSPDSLRRLAYYRMTGTTPTVGKLTRDPAQFTQEENLMRIGANSKDPAAQTLGSIKNANNARLIELMNNVGAGTKDDTIAGAEKIMGALGARNDRANEIIGSLYDKARDSAGRSADLDRYTFAQRANDLLDEAMLGGKLPADVRNMMNWISSGEKPAGMHSTIPMPFNVDVSEQFKTRIGALQRASSDKAERMALGLVRQALDEAPLVGQQAMPSFGGNQLAAPGTLPQNLGQEAINAFNKARGMNRSWMQIVERTPALQAVRDGVEPDKFVQQYVVGSGDKASTASLAALRQSIKASPEAMTAVKEQIVAHLKKQALSGAEDEVGNVSQSAYNKALNAIGERKLRMFFTPDEVAQLKAIGKVAAYEQVEPKGGAVNRSATAGAQIAALLDRIGGSALLSKVPFGKLLQQPAENIVIGLRAKDALNTPRALVAPAAQGAAARPVLALSPAVFTGQDEERR